MEELVDARLRLLLAKAIEGIRILPECVQEEIMLDGTPCKLTTYHETLEGDEHRLIVQAIRPRWGGLINAAIAKGHIVSAAGVRRELTVEELYDYT